MLVIDIKNVENLIFFDKAVQRKLPEFKELFDQWAIGKRLPTIKFVSQKAIYTLLEQLNEEHIKILEQHFNKQIKVGTIDYHLVRHCEIDVNKPQKTILNNFLDICITRNKDKAYISFWR